ncbi:MAG: helix-turn-helix transcriptional regulator [Candidatus Sericytochromatia bacterium]|nr:helix-turn-helix transcriptional regulator [Candidatus Sericytochromatia bacterium]
MLLDVGEQKETIGQILRTMRQQRGLSLRSVASQLRMSHSRLAELERGVDAHTGRAIQPSYNTVRALARIYAVPPDPLLRLAGFTVVSDLTADEQKLLACFRQLSEEARQGLLTTACLGSGSDSGG